MSLIKHFIWLIILFLFINACDDENTVVPTKMYSEYIPLETGKFIIYDVDSYVYYYDYYEKYFFQLKEFVADTFSDEQQRVTFRIERYFRNNDSDIWNIKDVWAANQTITNYERVEENNRFIRLRFPVKEDLTWNPNVYNSFDPVEFKYINIHTRMSLLEHTFDSTATVMEKNFGTRIENQYEMKVYAIHTGLVYSYKDSLQLDFVTGDTIGGFKCRQTVKEFN